ncbi:MAG: hypothetical protein GTO02_19855, partial [Candidatus Dadabacteria bacterium]|nr:hypothetical protein [Candidatus Dadabacteria bacterium]NIQ16556.1 hypothetical protein [Candidatus Dadabacteria bacterium]
MIKNKLYTALIIFLFLLPYLSCTDLLSKNIIGPDGGTIVTSDGLFTLEIPEGALTEDVEITLTRDEGIEGDVLVYDAEPSGLEFLLPAIFSGDVTDISNNGENDKNIM